MRRRDVSYLVEGAGIVAALVAGGVLATPAIKAFGFAVCAAQTVMGWF